MYLTDQGLEEIEQYASKKKNANILLSIQVLKELGNLKQKLAELETKLQEQPDEIMDTLRNSVDEAIGSNFSHSSKAITNASVAKRARD